MKVVVERGRGKVGDNAGGLGGDGGVVGSVTMIPSGWGNGKEKRESL